MENVTNIDRIFGTIVSIFSIFIIVYALFGNTLALIIFQKHKELKQSSTIKYLSFISVLDTLSLFEWNLDNFLKPNFSFRIQYSSVIGCKLFTFVQYFSLQSSALILSLSTIDRYFCIIRKPGSFTSRLPFSTLKSAKYWSVLIIVFVALFNSPLLILNGFYINTASKNSTSNKIKDFKCYWYSGNFSIFASWQIIHLFIYSLIQSIFMIIFNLLLILKIISIKNSNGIKKINKMNISLIMITVLFLFMTLPTNVMYSFFNNDVNPNILDFLDSISFLNHTSIFVICFITHRKFRTLFFLICKNFKNKLKILFDIQNLIRKTIP